jgi:hypothetical protein
MSDINHKLFKEKFYEFTGKTFDIVSTIDHPYASPPVRLVDGHNKLKKLNRQGLKPLICVWDVNYPNINRYRYELIFDSGIFNNKEEDFFIFSEKFLYPLQRPKSINFSEVKKRIRLIIRRLNNLPKESKEIKEKIFIKNFETIINIYTKTIEVSNNGTNFYQNLLEKIYNLIELPDLSNFIENSFQPYFGSPIIKEWIPYCIQITKNEPCGFLNLLDEGLFKMPYFRQANIGNEKGLFDAVYVKKNIDEVLELIRNGKLIPSYEIFFWTLFLADVKHFGNDYGFFNKLDKIATQRGFKFSKNIQLTEHNKDSENIIQFEKDRTFNCFLQNGNYAIRKNNPTKNSRTSSLPALYCHLGENLGKIIRNILEGKISCPKIVKNEI